MTEPKLYSVRPLKLATPLRIHLSAGTMYQRLQSGDICSLQKPNGGYCTAVAYLATEKIGESVMQLTQAFQDLQGIKLKDKLSLQTSSDRIQDASSVILTEVYLNNTEHHFKQLSVKERYAWEFVLEHVLLQAEEVTPGILFKNIELRGQRKSFKIIQINSSKVAANEIYRISRSTTVTFQGESTPEQPETEHVHSLLLSRDGIGGLGRQIEKLNQRIKRFTAQQAKYPPYYRLQRGGTLIHGPEGTGKTLIMRKALDAGWKKVFEVDLRTIGSRSLQNIFAEARSNQPSMIALDDLDDAASGEGSTTSSSILTLAKELNNLGDSKIFVLAATVSLRSLDKKLRGRAFGLKIEIPIPDSQTRAEILKVIVGIPRDQNDDILDNLGDKTHGFVGEDLDQLVEVAIDKAESRIIAASGDCSGTEIEIIPTDVDYDAALLEIRPAAMQEVFLETPKVRWTDIGGGHQIKKTLQHAVEWPFKYPTLMLKFGLSPARGLLLYGPPGCSKTLTAKAVATEASLNFLAVKGAELLNMYVGESERAVREVFRKARAASPSILFFDEIDAIGARSGAGAGGVNVLTTLLNELDGIEVLKGVFVLAATNKPEALDPALMRPGRLDQLLYVGLPDQPSREEIVRIALAKMEIAVDVQQTWLAEATMGYSGAEIVSVCQCAGHAAMEEEIEGGVEGVVERRHFDRGLEEVPRQITADMVAGYEVWGRRDGR